MAPAIQVLFLCTHNACRSSSSLIDGAINTKIIIDAPAVFISILTVKAGASFPNLKNNYIFQLMELVHIGFL